MDSQKGNSKGNRSNKRLTYFFLNGDLHKKIHINRGADLITAWNYPQHKRVGYSYSDVKRNGERGFKTSEAARMLRRTRLTLEHAIMNGDIEAPQKTYGIASFDGVKSKGEPYQYIWSEDDVMAMHAFLCTVHKGRPRNDGLVTPWNLPTAREVRAMINQEVVLYVKNDKGDFVPTWEAENF